MGKFVAIRWGYDVSFATCGHPTDFLTFSPFFHTRISTPSNWKKCSKGWIATIVITGYYYWRINFFFENQLTSGWDTAKFFLKINAPGITHKIKVVVNVWNIQNYKKKFENWWHPAEKTEIFLKFLYHYVPSFLSISWVSCFGLVVKTVNFKSKGRGFNPPRGNFFFEKIFFFYKNNYILRSNT